MSTSRLPGMDRVRAVALADVRPQSVAARGWVGRPPACGRGPCRIPLRHRLSHGNRRRARRPTGPTLAAASLTRLAAMLSVLTLAVAACAGDEDEQGAEELDLETLRTDTDAGTLEAEPLENAFVSEVHDDLFVGISLSESNGEEAQTVTAYLCDGDRTGIWLRGEMADDDVTRLGGFEDGAYLELVHDSEEDVVGGRAVVAGRDAGSFEATRAGGNAGLYRAEQATDQGDVLGGWVALDDGRQQGYVCEVHCWTGPAGTPVCVCVKTQ